MVSPAISFGVQFYLDSTNRTDSFYLWHYRIVSPLRLRPSTAAVEMMDERTVNQCMSCNSMFTVIVRKHHCASCGKIYCGKCSKVRANSEKGYLVRQRFCIKCEQECVNRSRSAQRLNYLQRGRSGREQTSPSPERSEPGSRSTSTGSQRRRSGTCSCSIHVEQPLTNVVICSFTQQPHKKPIKRKKVAAAPVAPAHAPSVSSPVDCAVQTEHLVFEHTFPGVPRLLSEQISLDETVVESDSGESCHEFSSYDLDLESIDSRVPALEDMSMSSALTDSMQHSIALTSADTVSSPVLMPAEPATQISSPLAADSAPQAGQNGSLFNANHTLAVMIGVLVLAMWLLGITADSATRAQSVFFPCRVSIVHFCSHEDFLERQQYQYSQYAHQKLYSDNFGTHSASHTASTVHPPGFYSLLSVPYVSFLAFTGSGSARSGGMYHSNGVDVRFSVDNHDGLRDTVASGTAWHGGLLWLLNSLTASAPIVLPYEHPETAEQVAAGLSAGTLHGSNLGKTAADYASSNVPSRSINILLVMERPPLWHRVGNFAGRLFSPLREGIENADGIYL